MKEQIVFDTEAGRRKAMKKQLKYNSENYPPRNDVLEEELKNALTEIRSLKARDARLREDLELLEVYLADTHGKKCSAWTLDVPPMLLKKVKKMKLLLVEEAKT